MYILDTSYWIEFLKGNDPLYNEVLFHIENKNVTVLSPIFGELLQGCRNRKEHAIIIQYWKNMPKVDETDLWIKAGELSYRNKLISKGIGLVDSTILIMAHENSLNILTLDKKLLRVWDTYFN